MALSDRGRQRNGFFDGLTQGRLEIVLESDEVLEISVISTHSRRMD